MSKLHEEYARIQQYEGHLKRLIRLKARPMTQIKKSQIHLKSISNQNSSSTRTKRIMTQHLPIDRSLLRKAKIKTLLPLPLIPHNEKELVSSSIKQKKLPQREAEILLQNYLLSRRILKVRSCIKNTSFQKSYRKHEQYSNLRSKSRLCSLNMSESRLKKFKEFECSSSTQENKKMGNGRYIFCFSIKKLQKIRRQSEAGTLYNLVAKVGKKCYKFNNLAFINLKQEHKFNFKKNDLDYPYEIAIEIQLIIQNEVSKYGQFIIDASQPFCKLKGLPKGQQFMFQKNNQIQGLKSMRNDKLIGTVVFDYQITTRNHQT